MYPNLNAELARRGWNKKVLSEKLDVRYATIVDKLNGKYPLTLNECKEIKDKLDTKMSIDELFFYKVNTKFRIKRADRCKKITYK